MKKTMSVIALALLAASVMFAQDLPPVSGGDNSGGGGSGGGGGSSVPPTFTGPDKVPLASPKVLQAYALTLVGTIGVQVYGNSVSGDSYRWVDYPYEDADPDRMASIASSIELKFSATTDDQLTSWVSYNSRMFTLTDPDENEVTTAFGLFNGGKNFKLEYFKDAWRVPTNAYAVELEVGQVPWVVPGMRNAYITTRDEKGNYTGYYDFRQQQGDYWLDRGVIFLTEQLTSRRGDLTTILENGSKVVYDITSGWRKYSPTIKGSGFKPTIKGIRTVPDNTIDIVYRETDEIVRVAYTGDYHGSNTFQNVFVEFPGELKRYPAKVFVIDTRLLALNPDAEWLEFNPYVEPVWFRMKVGQAVLIRFEYQIDPEPLDNGGGGKGAKVAPVKLEE
ncbi:MAG: hypothetical protein Q7K35_01780 [bacterium]|nr:hypothetical protein [bacterium]